MATQFKRKVYKPQDIYSKRAERSYGKRMLKIIVRDDYKGMSEEAERIFREHLRRSDVIGFATGSTPLLLYKRLSSMCRSGKISFKDKISFNLDEYYRIHPSDPRSFRHFMDTNLFNNIDIRQENIHFPDSTVGQKAAVERYKKELEEHGPIDFQILGIGRNGHIAFNEPGSGMNSGIRIISLSRDTIERNGNVPQKAITMGIAEILSAGTIMLMASGKDKKEAMEKALYGPITADVPASFLRKHSNVYIVADSAALPPKRK